MSVQLDRHIAPRSRSPPSGRACIKGSQLRVTRIEGQSFGAVITGIQVNDLSIAELNLIKKTLNDHALVVFRDQELTPDEEFAFAQQFPHSKTCDYDKLCGPLGLKGLDQEWMKFKIPSRPEVQLRGYGYLKDHHGVKDYMLDTGKGAMEFHSDSLHEYDTPPVFTSLYCIATPGSYDGTIFLDARLAYDLLSDVEKEKASSLFVQYKRIVWPLHESGLKADLDADPATLGSIYGEVATSNLQSGDKADFRPQVEVSEVHPLVWTHQNTGRKAIISAAMWMYRIVEADGTPWTPKMSHDYVYSLLQPAVQRQYTHNWQPKDLVYFDNRSLQHSASPVPEKQGFRLLHQIIMCGNLVPTGPAGVGVGNPAVNPSVKAER